MDSNEFVTAKPIKVGQVWRHFKGAEYVVLVQPKECSQDFLVPHVVYARLDGTPGIWSRPLGNFYVKYEVDRPCTLQARFTLIKDGGPWQRSLTILVWALRYIKRNRPSSVLAS